MGQKFGDEKSCHLLDYASWFLSLTSVLQKKVGCTCMTSNGLSQALFAHAVGTIGLH